MCLSKLLWRLIKYLLDDYRQLTYKLTMQLAYSGSRIRIYHAEDAAEDGSEPVDSWNEAINHAALNDLQLKKLVAKMASRISALGDTGRLRTPDYFRKESLLPNGKHFYAIKAAFGRHHIRAYGWFSDAHKRSFIISHYAYKKGEKLSSEDTNRVGAAWRMLEQGA